MLMQSVDRPFALPAPQSVSIELAGDPKGKGRPRFARKLGIAYTPAITRNYEAALRYAAQMAMGNQAPLHGPLKVMVLARFAVPQSWSQRKKVDALNGCIRPTGRPDADNLLKTMDALNGVVWRDDSQVVDAHIVKRYSDRPCLYIEVEGI